MDKLPFFTFIQRISWTTTVPSVKNQTGDKTWVFACEPEDVCQSLERKLPIKNKFKTQ